MTARQAAGWCVVADQQEPASWLMLEFVAGRIRLIKRADGFFTDLGTGYIALDDDVIKESTELAGVVISAARIAPTTTGRAQGSSEIEITVEIAVPRGGAEVNPRRLLHRARADVMRVLYFDTRSMPMGITKFEVTDTRLADTVDDDEGHTSVIAQITARAGLTETFQPVTTP